MGHTAPTWFAITAFVILLAGLLGFVAWAVVPWVVRPRFPHADTDPRLAPTADDDLMLQLAGPVRRVRREALEAPAAHQPAARPPGGRRGPPRRVRGCRMRRP